MPDDQLEFYQEVILDHSMKPRNRRVLPNANHTARGHNPRCGDDFTIYVEMDGDVVKDVSFQGAGCAIATASASMLTEYLKGKSKADARRMFDVFQTMPMTGTRQPELGQLAALVAVYRFPFRVKCATLPWHAAMAAIEGRRTVVSTELEDGHDDQE